MESNCHIILSAPIGNLKITGNIQGIQKIEILDTKENDLNISEDIPASISDPLVKCAKQLKEYFEGTRTDFDLHLNPQGTTFQKKVWKELFSIPYGKTSTYTEQAKKLGNVKAIRAVANANANNPLLIVIPCHRVIGSDGSLTGYAGGLWRKKWLLNHEKPSKQQSLF